MKIFANLTQYLKEAVAEMKKVVWPTKKQTTFYSVVVIVISLGVAIFFGVLDYIFNLGLEAIIK